VPLELRDQYELYVKAFEDDADNVCEIDELPDALLLEHDVNDALAEGDILELAESERIPDELPDRELAGVELTVSV